MSERWREVVYKSVKEHMRNQKEVSEGRRKIIKLIVEKLALNSKLGEGRREAYNRLLKIGPKG